MNHKNHISYLGIFLCLIGSSQVMSQTLAETESFKFRVSGYLRTGLGYSEGNKTQAHFQIPGALNKYSLGNQADTYGELEFDYTQYLNKDKSKSLDAVWMTSYYEDFGTEKNMSYNFTEQLYLRANNLLGLNESIWFGNRFYDRRAIYMLDRQWINPGQKGWGGGVDHLLHREGNEDIKIGAWQFKDKDMISYVNGEKGDLTAYTVDLRWVNKPIAPHTNISMAVNYTRRMANEHLGYQAYNGFGAFTWLDYTKNNVTNTFAVLFRQGANVSMDHWSGMTQRENPGNDNLVVNNIKNAYALEINNEFLYDDKDRFAINVISMFEMRDAGTTPYQYVDGQKIFQEGKGNMFYWASAGARAMYYVCKQFRPSIEYSYEYGVNQTLGAKGSLQRISFTPELSLRKGFFERPVLRPFVTYAFWSDGLKGHVGAKPNGSPFGEKTEGFTYGLQFEIWW